MSSPAQKGDDAALPLDVELSKFNFGLIVEWIKVADAKASFLLTIALAMLGVSLTDIPSAARVGDYLARNSHAVLLISLVVVQLAYYAAILFAMWQLVAVIMPSLIRPSSRHSWFFFQSLSQLQYDDFKRFSAELDLKAKRAQLDDQIYNTAIVASKKYRHIRFAIWGLVVAGVLGVLSIAPVLIVDTLYCE